MIHALIFLIWGAGAQAESYLSIQERRPELFHPETGYRIDQQRAPTPEDIPAPAQLVGPEGAKVLIADGALVLDVFGALQSRYDELDGTWLVSEPRMSLPGAVWLPEVGRGVLDTNLQRYLQAELQKATMGDTAHPIVVYCVADCWMSWNAAQRITDLGYSQVFWFQLGTDGWREHGWPLAPVEPVPVNVD
ncbi:MAG: PQQ-dependent catabolism-associated CXXCW motif protein [Dinoroseobacter sp.]|nr:PQQ-dependent catabolism-associated CXXCW motif protein [Dinoroseobacter sp.]